MNARLRTISVSLSALALAVMTAACGSDPASDPSAEGDADSTPVVAGTQEPVDQPGITLVDPWVKAVEGGMTAAFGTLQNDSDADVTLVSASTEASPVVELHEMLVQDGKMVMQEKAGGITIPAGGTAELAPGGDHIMLMDVTEAIAPGDVIMLTLSFDDGSTLEVEATAKEYAGGEEEYVDGDMEMPMTSTPAHS